MLAELVCRHRSPLGLPLSAGAFMRVDGFLGSISDRELGNMIWFEERVYVLLLDATNI
jgi:hypothetical protein